MKKNIIAILVPVMMLLLNSLFVYSQQSNPRFEDLKNKVGIYGDDISKLQQDRHGYLWISSYTSGLLKYDGYTVTKYLNKPFDPNSVAQNTVYTFFIDKSDTIWLGTPEGLCKFDPLTEKFIRYDSSLFRGMPDLGNVCAINEDNQGNLWIGDYDGKLWRYNREKSEFLSFTSKLDYQEQHSLMSGFHEAIMSIYKDKKGVIWIGSTTGLHRATIKPGKAGASDEINFTQYRHDSNDTNSLSDNQISGIYEDSNSVLWIGTVNGLNSLDPITGKVIRFLANPSNKFSISSNHFFYSGQNSIVEDAKGNLWIATDSGLNKLNKERTRFTAFFQDNSDFGLKSNGIVSLGLDAGNNLFVGTAKGLQSLNLDPKAFGLLQHDTKDSNSLSDNNVSAILEDKSGTTWIGTFGGGLNKWDKKTGTINHFEHDPKNPGSIGNNIVDAILEDEDGDLWLGDGEYLSHLKTTTGIFENFNSNVRNLKDEDAKNIYAICRDRDGLIWMGTGNGIKSFNPATKKFNHYFYVPGDPSGISDYSAVKILADSRGNIWVGTNSIAFNKFDKITGRFTHYKNNALDTNSISSNIVNCLFEDSKGNLWIGTSGGGLCRYDYNSKSFSTPGRTRQNPWNAVFSIREDNSGNLWLGTDKGLSCYFPEKNEFVNYDENDGLQGNHFATGFKDQGCSFKGKDGILYFGGDNGLTYFDPAQIHPNKYIPPVVITQFKIFDKLQPGKNEDSEIVLNYDQNFFSFEFAALNFTNTSKNQYAYQLEGFDPNWIKSGSRRYAGYTNLGPGTYTFKVKGSNNDGVWNDKGISIKVIILPPWWRTWWAYVIYALLLIAGVLAFDRYQKRRVILAEREKAHKKELAQAKEIEKAYHELKTTQAQLIQSEKMASLGELTAGIAHEIQNPLNFVNNFSEVNRELIGEIKEERVKDKNERDEKLEDELLNNIDQNLEKISHHGKRADAIVKGMLQHSSASGGQKELTDINALADEYLRLSYHGLRAKDKEFNTIMKTDFDETIGKINIIPQDIGRVLLNLYNNAFYAVSEKKKQQPNGYEPTISVTTKKINNKVEITVKDNGNGIPKKVLDKIFQPFFTTKPTGVGTGLGLSLSYDIVKAHGGELKVETKEGEGSEFIIQLPTT
jgi:ligand-binding sensor domain-containing protein/signal transduction histidine kinase